MLEQPRVGNPSDRCLDLSIITKISLVIFPSLRNHSSVHVSARAKFIPPEPLTGSMEVASIFAVVESLVKGL